MMSEDKALNCVTDKSGFQARFWLAEVSKRAILCVQAIAGATSIKDFGKTAALERGQWSDEAKFWFSQPGTSLNEHILDLIAGIYYSFVGVFEVCTDYFFTFNLLIVQAGDMAACGGHTSLSWHTAANI